MSIRIKTVNVITTDEQGAIQVLVAFNDDDEGNQKAEKLFSQKVRSVLALEEVTEDEMEEFVDDGFAMNAAGETCQLVHSGI